MKNLKRNFQNIFRTSVLILSLAFLPLNIYHAVDSEKISQNSGSISRVQKSEIKENSEVVYITKTGKCYHKVHCHCLKYSKIEISEDKAQENDYKECSKCFG